MFPVDHNLWSTYNMSAPPPPPPPPPLSLPSLVARESNGHLFSFQKVSSLTPSIVISHLSLALYVMATTTRLQDNTTTTPQQHNNKNNNPTTNQQQHDTTINNEAT